MIAAEGRQPITVDLGRWADQDPASPALVFDDGIVTSAVLSVHTAIAADRLARAGVQGGDVVMLDASGDLPGVATLLGCWTLGAVPALLHTKTTAAERDWAAQLLRPGFVADGAGVRPTDLATPLSLRDHPGIGAVLLTSGSTGRPRAIGIGIESLRFSSRAVVDRLAAKPGEGWGLALSMAHVGGLALLSQLME